MIILLLLSDKSRTEIIRAGIYFGCTDFCRLGHRFSQYCVYQCYVCGNLCFIAARWWWCSPTRKAECRGRSPRALSRGLSVIATPEPYDPSERREFCRQGSRFSRLSDASRKMLRYRGLRFATPSAKSHSLRSGVRPFRSRCGEASDYQPLRGWFCGWVMNTTPVAALPLCGANHKPASPRLSGRLMGAWKSK